MTDIVADSEFDPEEVVSSGTAHPPRLTRAQKLFQGIGGAVDAARGAVIGPILLYYNIILGVPATWVSAAIFLTIVIDAVTDPLIGSWSDNTRSRLGRRHPFMYASIIPLTLSVYFVLMPPEGLGHLGLVVWIAVLGSLVNISMTLFSVPYWAMLAELTDDYEERTEIASYRMGATVISVALFTAASLVFFLASTDDYPQGQLNPEGYPNIALAAAILAFLVTFVTTHFTRDRIKFMPQVTQQTRTHLQGLYKDILDALSNRNFLIVFLAFLLASVINGAMEVMSAHMSIFFWEFRSEDQAWMTLGGFGALAAVFLAGLLQKGFQKHHVVFWAVIAGVMVEPVMVIGRFLDLVPENGTTAIVVLATLSVIIRFGAMVLMSIFIGSMIGDIVAEHEYNSGRKQGGVMFAGLGFSQKAILGLGTVAGGIMLDLTGLPSGDVTSGAEATTAEIIKLGLYAGILLPALMFIPAVTIRFFDLSRDRYQQISDALAHRNSSTHPSLSAPSSPE